MSKTREGRVNGQSSSKGGDAQAPGRQQLPAAEVQPLKPRPVMLLVLALILIAMLIATMKASLVAAFFMHLRYDKLFNTLAFLGSFLFLAIFILLTYDDLGDRGKIDYSYGGTVDPHTGAVAPGGAPTTTATQDDVEEEAPPKGEKPAPPLGEKK